MKGLFERFDLLDTTLNRWLVANSITILRISLGLVFLAFGALKFFSGPSPSRSWRRKRRVCSRSG